MKNAADILAEFRSRIGVDRFRRFVHQVVRDASDRNELRFWQERCYREFVACVPEAPTRIDEIRNLFLRCFVHDRSLSAVEGRVGLPEIRETDDWIAALEELFPFSFGSHLCADCVLARDVWLAEHEDECRMLRRRTTWEEYRAAHEWKTAPEFKKAFRVAKLVIPSDMLAGDELWEWDGGRGITGLAIVRDGKMKTSWIAPLE